MCPAVGVYAALVALKIQKSTKTEDYSFGKKIVAPEMDFLSICVPALRKLFWL
jgi:hypothetical protein